MGPQDGSPDRGRGPLPRARPSPPTTPGRGYEPSSWLLRISQPQGNMRRLHRLPHHIYKVAVQLVEVRLIAQLRGECFERLCRIVLPAVEAAVYEVLDAAAQWIEERGDCQGGGHDSQLRPLAR